MVNLTIYLHKKKIGIISSLPGDLNLFSFDEDYLNDKNRATLSLSFQNKITQGVINHIPPTRLKLPPFFSNLLPEGQLREYLASSDDIHPDREFFLLRALGLDLPGAITAKIDSNESWPKEAFVHPHTQLKKDSLRFSLAGVQLKFSAVAHSKKHLTIPAQGIGGQWILKLPSLRFAHVPENEFAMMSLAQKIGITVPDVKLISLNDIKGFPRNIGKMEGKVLAIKRFDRSEEGPIHIEDFAQIFSLYPHEKYGKINYKNIAEVIWGEVGKQGVIEFIKRLVFNTLIGNADMHAKNWSLMYPDRIHAELAPAYDFVSTIVYLNDEGMALNYVKTKKWRDADIKLFSTLAEKAKIPEEMVLHTVKETVQLFHEHWQKEKKHLGIPDTFTSMIDKHIKIIPLTKNSK